LSVAFRFEEQRRPPESLISRLYHHGLSSPCQRLGRRVGEHRAKQDLVVDAVEAQQPRHRTMKVACSCERAMRSHAGATSVGLRSKPSFERRHGGACRGLKPHGRHRLGESPAFPGCARLGGCRLALDRRLLSGSQTGVGPWLTLAQKQRWSCTIHRAKRGRWGSAPTMCTYYCAWLQR
jgi:hypothetical protein